MKTFKKYLSEAIDLESIDLKKFEKDARSIFSKMFEFKNMSVKHQRVFGGSEIQIRFDSAVLNDVPLDYFGIQIQQSGLLTADASSKKLHRKHLASQHDYGTLKLSDVQMLSKHFIESVVAIQTNIENNIAIEKEF